MLNKSYLIMPYSPTYVYLLNNKKFLIILNLIYTFFNYRINICIELYRETTTSFLNTNAKKFKKFI